MFARQRGIRIVALVASFALLIGVAGCGAIDSLTTSSGSAPTSASSESRDMTTQDMAPATDGGTGSLASAPYAADKSLAPVAQTDRLIVRNKALRIEVKKVAEALDLIKSAAKKHEGIITNMQVASDSGSPVYRYDDTGTPSDGAPLLGYVTVRVPADAFSAFVDEVSKIGTVRYQAESTDDVTQQHVDMSARLDNLRAEEKRLREFFTAADNVKDMLAVESELSRVRGEIESLDAQVKYLERQAAMATVTIDLSEPQAVVRPSGENWGFGDAVTTGFRGAAGAVQLLIIVTITVLPYLLIAAILFFAIRAIVRARRKSRTATDAAEPSPEEHE